MQPNVNVQTNQDTTDGGNNTEKPKIKSNSHTDIMYFIEITINGKKAYAFVDTGSAMSLISFDGAVRRGLGNRIDTRHRDNYIGMSGTKKFIGTIMKCKLKIEDFSIFWSFRVPTNGFIIIGADILRHFKAKMDISKRTLVLHFKEEPTILPLITLSEIYNTNELKQYTTNPFTINDLTKKMKNFFHCKALDKMYESALQRNPLALQYGRCSFIKVNLNGHKITAMIDTGCAINVICEKIASHYNLKQFVDNDSKGNGVTGSDGKRVILEMVTQCDIGIDDCSFVETLYVIPTKISFILGTAFLNRIKAKVDFENNNLEFWTADRGCTVLLLDEPF